MFFHLSRQHLQTSVVLPSPSKQPGTPFVSSFCTPNPNQRPIHTPCFRPPPSVPKMPLGVGQICSHSASEDRPSVKCMRACVCVLSLGGSSQSAVLVNVYLHTALVSAMLKSPLWWIGCTVFPKHVKQWFRLYCGCGWIQSFWLFQLKLKHRLF